jgi:hypothetical protein
MTPTDLSKHADAATFLKKATSAFNTDTVEKLLVDLPIVGDHEYIFHPDNPSAGWREGYLHWYPVGGERGNAGRIKLAGAPENPIAERTVNAFEATIEMMRQLELKGGYTDPPETPREAVQRYFELPPLSEVPKLHQLIKGQKPRKYVRELAKQIRIRLIRQGKQYSIAIEDDGIGQAPVRIHSTLLSLGQSDKADKPYLIGVFGQGGSSAYATCTYSCLLSRRHPQLLDGSQDGIGWTVIKHVYPKGRRDDYFAYLATHPDGRVPALPPEAGNAIALQHGTTFTHINYDFGKTEPARRLYPALNHLLFNPILPYELYTRPEPKADPMFGNGYRLSLNHKNQVELDKTFRDQFVEA